MGGIKSLQLALMGVALTGYRISVIRYEKLNYYNFTLRGPIQLKLNLMDKCHTPNTTKENKTGPCLEYLNKLS